MGHAECMAWALVAGAMASLSTGDLDAAITPLHEALETSRAWAPCGDCRLACS